MKNKIFFIVVAIFLIIAFIFTFKDTYSYYIDTNNLSLVSSKIGKFGSVSLDGLKKNAGSQLQDTAVFGLYRYNGTKDIIKNNYICFGTNDKSTCLGDPSTYMYRIIGITDNSTTNTDLNIPENSLKIIKATSYGKYVWHNTDGATWDTALLNTSTLNTTFYNSIAADWKAKILSNHYWYIGDKHGTGKDIETTKSSTNKPIGLMYFSDYYNAGIQNTNNWLFIQNGWSGNIVWEEWTMIRSDAMDVYRVTSSGGFNYWLMYNSQAVRPVFYLISDISLKGTGADSDPYLIS